MPTKRKTAFSYSFLHNHCPRNQKEIGIDKSYPVVESTPMRLGKLMHTQLEEAISLGQPVPPELEHLVPIVNAFRKGAGFTKTEQQLAVTDKWTPCGWFGKNVMWRAVVDALHLDAPLAILADWKGGKARYADGIQLGDMAACVFAHHPDIEDISAFFGWKNPEDKIKVHTFSRAVDYPNLKLSIAARIAEFRKYESRDYWPEEPGFQCRSCPIMDCKFKE